MFYLSASMITYLRLWNNEMATTQNDRSRSSNNFLVYAYVHFILLRSTRIFIQQTFFKLQSHMKGPSTKWRYTSTKLRPSPKYIASGTGLTPYQWIVHTTAVTHRTRLVQETKYFEIKKVPGLFCCGMSLGSQYKRRLILWIINILLHYCFFFNFI